LSGGQGAKLPEAENLLAFGAQWSSKFSSFFKLQTMTNPQSLPPEKKLTGFASISGTTSGKSGVDMSTQSTPWRRPWTDAFSDPTTLEVVSKLMVQGHAG